MEQQYDVIVIGGGPAGCTAALYTARSGFSTLIIEKMAPGGQMTETNRIENYPGFADGIDGITLGSRMMEGAQQYGARALYAQVLSARLGGPVKTVETSQGTYQAKSVIIATGAGHRRLGLEQEEQLVGSGISYCAVCDGLFYRGKTVAVVGGGNSAAADALTLSRIAERVILIHRRDTLRASKIYHDTLAGVRNVEFRWNSTVTELLHNGKLTGVKLRDVNTGEDSILALDGLFISVGRAPVTQLFADQLELDSAGYIAAGESTETSLPGVYAAGDVRTKAVRQIVTAVGDGAAAAHFAEQYLTGRK